MHHKLKETVCMELVYNLRYSRMIHIKRYEPVHSVLEECKPLHLRETSEVDVRTLFLHALHPTVVLLQLLHPAFLGIGMQNILHRIVLNLLDTISGNLEIAVIKQSRQYFLLNGLIVFLCIHTEI